MKKFRPAFLLTCLGFSLAAAVQTACVTVNVNFPESAVQKATDDYVRDLYRAKEKGKTPSSDEASPAPASKVSTFFTLESAAYADDFSVQSPKADAISSRLRSRIGELITQKKEGTIGENNEGFLAVRSSPPSPLLAKKVKTLVEEDNSDRMALYQEVIRINGLDSGRLASIQKNFARSFQSQSPSGTWVQDPDGKWARKP